MIVKKVIQLLEGSATVATADGWVTLMDYTPPKPSACAAPAVEFVGMTGPDGVAVTIKYPHLHFTVDSAGAVEVTNAVTRTASGALGGGGPDARVQVPGGNGVGTSIQFQVNTGSLGAEAHWSVGGRVEWTYLIEE